MKRYASVVCILTVLLAGGAISASEIGLTAVLFPEGKQIDVPMSGTQRAPAADLTAKVRHRDGQSEIEIHHKKLPPAILFGGDIVSFVSWAVSPNGKIENLGGIANNEESGTATYSSATREFALMITAEPIATVGTPGELVVFFSGTPAVKDLTLTAFTYGGLSDRGGHIVHDNESIAGMTYKPNKKQPLAMIQADKAGDLLDRFDAKQHDPDGYARAMNAISEAVGAKGDQRLDASKRAVELAGQSLAKTVEMIQQEETAAKEARMAAERQSLTGEATDLKAQLEATAAKLAATEAQLGQSEASLKVAVEKGRRADAQVAHQARQRAALSKQLSGAMGQMATTASTDRGYVVSLSGTAFPSGKSTLTTDAKYVLAKLSGLVLAMGDPVISVEGHTDSTGGDELNMKLSQGRADAVKLFLTEMGMTGAKIKAQGFGPSKPIAPNDNAEGRAKNRRVEIIMAE